MEALVVLVVVLVVGGFVVIPALGGVIAFRMLYKEQTAATSAPFEDLDTSHPASRP